LSKRSNFDKIPRDFYPTFDTNATPPSFIREIRGKRYAEPCCGQGDLVELLYDAAICKWESDIEDRGLGFLFDAMCLTKNELWKCDLIITNPPYTRKVILPMIDHFISLKPTWLLLPADWMHNKYFGPYMDKCSKVISVGRLKWFKDSLHSSTDNYCWYYWKHKASSDTDTVFIGRKG
jgi:hypothetical protein